MNRTKQVMLSYTLLVVSFTRFLLYEMSMGLIFNHSALDILILVWYLHGMEQVMLSICDPHFVISVCLHVLFDYSIFI